MIRKAILLLAVCTLPLVSAAQEALSSKQMIAITPMISHSLPLPADARSSLGIKLGQMVTQNGFGSNSGMLVLTANMAILDKQTTATAPVQYLVETEVSVYLLDVMEQVVIDEISFVVKGVDRLENKAMIQAIKQINPRSPKARAWMDGCKTKIIEYYNTRIPTLMTKAQSLADRDQYAEALAVLASIPENVDQYPAVAEQMTAMYIKMIDREATTAIQAAKSYMALRDYELALDALLAVDPSSTKSKEAFALVSQIKNTIDAAELAAKEEQLRRYEEQQEAAQRAHDDQMMLAKMQIEAAQKVGSATSAKAAGAGGSQSSGSNNLQDSLNKWFISKFL